MKTQKVAIAFGRVLRQTRLQSALSQDKLAALCDFDRTYTSLLERGLRSPTLAMVLRLSQALEVNPALLVTKTLEELQRL